MALELGKPDPAWAWSPYVPDGQQPWNRVRAAHLYRRAGFGATWQQLDDALKLEPAAAVKQFFALSANAEAADRQFDELAQTVLLTANPQNLSAWWLYRLLQTPRQLPEKMTVFWHGHFATSAAKVMNARMMYDQNVLLRRNALGSFGAMVQAISRDPAMMVYLDSTSNRKAHPNENYAREVMELFCLGVGNYTEKDIQELARCFTGWEVVNDKFRFNDRQHDAGSKTVLGQSGDFGGEEAVRIVVSQPAAPRFIAKKLIRFFVSDELELSPDLVDPLAKALADHDFEIAPAVEMLLSSRLFFSDFAIGRKVRSPVELGVGLLRSLEGTSSTYRLADELDQLGQHLFFPPSVKGWDGGRTWINSSTLLGRANLVRQLVQTGGIRLGGGGLETLADRYGMTTPEKMVDWLLELLVAVPVGDDVRSSLADLVRPPKERSRGLGELVHTIGGLPEFQLS